MEKMLIVTPKKYKGDTSVFSTRISNDLLKRIDDIANRTGRTRNEIVQLCLEFAVDNIEIKNED